MDLDTTPRPVVLACGLATCDVVQTVDRLPAPDEKVVARDLLVASGGPAANAAVTATALGVPARLLTRVGGTLLGRLVAEDLQAHGVDVLDVATPGTSPAVSTVLVTAGTGQRAVVSVNATLAPPPDADGVAGGGPETVSEADGDRDVLDRALAGATAVLVDGHHLDLALAVGHRARALGVPVVLDGGSWKPGLEELLPLVDVALLSADLRVPDDLSGADPDPLRAVHALGTATVARSRGDRPLQLLTADGVVEVAVPAVRVVDTLGAGDVLHGALVAWVARHGTADVARALTVAGRVASASCAAPGARGWLARADEVAELRAALTADR